MHGKGKKMLSLYLTNQSLHQEDVRGSIYTIYPYFLDLGTNWRWVVSLMPLSLYPRRKTPTPPVTLWIGGYTAVTTNLTETHLNNSNVKHGNRWTVTGTPSLSLPLSLFRSFPNVLPSACFIQELSYKSCQTTLNTSRCQFLVMYNMFREFLFILKRCKGSNSNGLPDGWNQVTAHKCVTVTEIRQAATAATLTYVSGRRQGCCQTTLSSVFLDELLDSTTASS
jgi:hypothetical protein